MLVLQDYFDTMLNNPVIIGRIVNLKETVEKNRHNLVHCETYEDWNPDDLHRLFIAVESHTARLNQRKFGDGDLSKIKKSWQEFRELFTKKMLCGKLLGNKDYTEICAFFEQLGITGKTPAINRLILNFSNFDMVSICTEMHMKMLVKLLNKEFGYQQKYADWLQSAENVWYFFYKNVNCTNSMELIHLGWYLLEYFELVECDYKVK